MVLFLVVLPIIIYVGLKKIICIFLLDYYKSEGIFEKSKGRNLQITVSIKVPEIEPLFDKILQKFLYIRENQV
jgi:hypothetical protein